METISLACDRLLQIPTFTLDAVSDEYSLRDEGVHCVQTVNTRRNRTRLRINARSHRVFRRADDSRWRRCRRVVRGCVARGSATSGARASAHQRRCFLSPFLSLSLPSSAPGSLMRVALDAARQGRFSTRSRFPLVYRV